LFFFITSSAEGHGAQITGTHHSTSSESGSRDYHIIPRALATDVPGGGYNKTKLITNDTDASSAAIGGDQIVSYFVLTAFSLISGTIGSKSTGGLSIGSLS
jgi:hypothetical protein